jgi:xanthine dehydrogenase accessory factor
VFPPSRLEHYIQHRIPAALVTVVRTRGSTPRKVGAAMVVIDDGSEYGVCEGTIGGGAVEHTIRTTALLCIREDNSQLVDISLTKDLAMCCGGNMSVFIEPIKSTPHILIFGAGHVGAAAARLAMHLDYHVTVVDEREELLHTLQKEFGLYKYRSYLVRYDDHIGLWHR